MGLRQPTLPVEQWPAPCGWFHLLGASVPNVVMAQKRLRTVLLLCTIIHSQYTTPLSPVTLPSFFFFLFLIKKKLRYCFNGGTAEHHKSVQHLPTHVDARLSEGSSTPSSASLSRVRFALRNLSRRLVTDSDSSTQRFLALQGQA